MYQILIVDEDPGFLAITKIFLEHSGSIFADTALTADEALETLFGGSYDAVIFGTLQESLRDGTMVHTIREGAGPMPVILMVEEYQAEEGVLALKKGISHVIVRTPDPKEQFHDLIVAIHDLVDQSREEVAFQFHDAILSLVTQSAQRFLTESADPDEILSLFTSFGEATGIARASLISLKQDETGTVVPHIEVTWNAFGTKGRLSSPDPVHIVRMKGCVLTRIAEKIRNGENYISSTREFSREELEDGGFAGITGILAIPVFAGGEVWGCIVIEDAERERTWSDIKIDAIRGMADIIGAAAYSEAQKELVTFLSAMVQQVSDAVIAYNQNNRIVYANTAAGNLLGTDAEAIKGEDITTVFPGSYHSIDADGVFSIPNFAVVRTVDGGKVIVDVKVTVLSSGKDAGTSVAVICDATERIRHQQMQSEAFARIDGDIRMMEKLGEDIRDPLMIILGHAEFAGGDSAEIIASQVQEIQRKMQDLDSAQLKSLYYRKLLREDYADTRLLSDEGETDDN